MKHSSGFIKISEAARDKIAEISVEELKTLDLPASRVRLIDVREDHEWLKGHIPDAIHLGRGIIERDIEKVVPDHDIKLILYCGGGYRSALSALSLQQMGYSNVYSLAGGYRAWVAAGLDVINFS